MVRVRVRDTVTVTVTDKVTGTVTVSVRARVRVRVRVRDRVRVTFRVTVAVTVTVRVRPNPSANPNLQTIYIESTCARPIWCCGKSHLKIANVHGARQEECCGGLYFSVGSRNLGSRGRSVVTTSRPEWVDLSESGMSTS